jgi:pimeloyl-ACP methyl ester carboxylesterase
VKLIGIAATAAALALPSLAVAEDATYDETQNWLAAWGQTQKDFTDPAETGGTVVNSAGNAAANAQDPDAAQQGPYQLHQWPWSGDPDREPCDSSTPSVNDCYDGQVQHVEFESSGGLTLDGNAWFPKSDALKDDAGRVPGIVISSGFQGNQKMYYWAAQRLAEAGYLVFTYDVSGQGHSEGQQTGPAADELRDALDFFISPERDWAGQLQADDIGIAGHSMGAGAVQEVGNDNRPEVKAISAWSDLGTGYTGTAPIQGQGADYDAWITPPVRDDVGPDDPGKLEGFDAVRERGVDVQEIVLESATHLAWSHVTWSYTSTWSEEIAFFYALAWFDKYLADDFSRDGVAATTRLVSNHESAESPGHGLSRKYLSAYSVGGSYCRDQRDREIDCVTTTKKKTKPPKRR